MFEKIGKFAVGCFVIYLVLGFLPFLLVGAGGAPVSGLVILGIVGAIAYANRQRIGQFFSPDSSSAGAHSPVSADDRTGRLALTRIRAIEHRIQREAPGLAERLPAEPLDSPALVDLAYVYLHEPPEESQAISREYSAHVNRLVQWHGNARQLLQHSESLTQPAAAVNLEAFERLDAELTAIQDYVSGLEARARDAQALPDQAIQTVEQAANELDRATIALRRATEQRPSPELESQLRLAAEGLRDARAALAGRERRPVTADRLAREAIRLAREVRAKADELVSLPDRLARREQEFRVTSARAERDVARAQQVYRAAEQEYAPTCLIEIRGLPEAAERALRNAREIWQSATPADRSDGSPDQRTPEAIMGEEDNAFAALEEGSQIGRTITEHVEMVQRTARGARGKVEAAEAEIDRGWAFMRRTTGSEALVRGGEEMLARAATLVAEARAELSVAKPDWLALVARAERGRELAVQVRSGSASAEPAADVRAAGEQVIPDRAGPAPAPFARADLERARERAKLARDRALAVSWTAGDRRLSEGCLQMIDQTERAYQRGVTLEKELGEQPRVHQPEMLESVLEAYRTAQGLGDTAYDQAQADLRRRQR